MNIHVSFNAGTTIREACTEARDFAIKMNLEWVEFKFNEIDCCISKKCDVDKACEMYFNASKIGSEFKFVIE